MRCTVLIAVWLVIFISCKDDLDEGPLSAGDNLTGHIGDTLALNGSGGPDLLWRIIRRPVLSKCLISDSTTRTANLIPDQPGLYKITLTDTRESTSDTIDVQVNARLYVGQEFTWEPFKTLAQSGSAGLAALGVSIFSVDVVEAPSGDCTALFTLPGLLYIAPVIGQYQIRQRVAVQQKSGWQIETFFIDVVSPPVFNNVNLAVLLREDFNTIDDSWTQTSDCCESYDNLSPAGSSTVPQAEAAGGLANLYSGVGHVSLERSLNDLDLGKYRYIKMELGLSKFNRTTVIMREGPPGIITLQRDDFVVFLGRLKLTPRVFPFEYSGADCYPPQNLSGKIITIYYDTRKQVVKVMVMVGNNTQIYTADFAIEQNTIDTYSIRLSSFVSIFQDSGPATALTNQASFDYIEISGGN
jgi:hypothetical protein